MIERGRRVTCDICGKSVFVCDQTVHVRIGMFDSNFEKIDGELPAGWFINSQTRGMDFCPECAKGFAEWKKERVKG